MESYFGEIAVRLDAALRGDEIYSADFEAETSDFVRFNRGAVRQAGSVEQRRLSVDLIDGRRHAGSRLSLAGRMDLDGPRIDALLVALRERLAALPEDPHLLYATEVRSSEVRRGGRLPEPGSVLDAVQSASVKADFVGVHAAGSIRRGFANALGQRNWFESRSHHLDWSLHADEGAVKCEYAGERFEREEFERRCALAAEQLRALRRPPRALEPGRYRVYLAPAALRELFDILAWGGFGLRAQRTGTSPLLRMLEGEARLAPSVTVRENTAEGIAPNFESAGFLRPDRVTLVRDGELAESLASPRSAVEYGVETNGASAQEAPLSVDLAAGELPRDDALRELGRGLYVGNLWYLNYSDRPACRTTGMTRFATFWVENGALAAPVPAMRFDETVYRMLGHGLLGLTREREMLLDADTYGRRSTRSARLPGALIEGVAFTL